MRILHILNDIENLGNGIINVAVDLACLQAKSGHSVGVISSGGGYEPLLNFYGVKNFFLDQTREPIRLIKVIGSYTAIINQFQPDVVHAHMMTGVLLARFLKGNADYTLVSTVHNEFQRSAILMGVADSVITVSQAVEKSMHKRGIAQRKLNVVLNGTLGSPRTRPLIEYEPLPLQRPAVVTVAGMYKRKGISELIDAFCSIAPSFPAAHLYLVGNGPDISIFEAQARGSKVSSRIHFEGFQLEPQKYLLSTDIFVLASHKDPSPLVISEARGCGCAIVATDVDGIPEALDDGTAGLLVPPFNSDSLAKALTKLLSNGNCLNYWKQQSQKNLDRLSVQRVHEQTLAIYKESIRRKSNVK